MNTAAIAILIGCVRLLAGAEEREDSVVAVAQPAANTEFDRTVAPLLESRCIACHDDVHAKGGLSLATREGALAGGRSDEPAIVPGSPDVSALIDAVSAVDGEPPAMPKGRPPLATAEVAALRDWIARGAPWPEGRVLVDRSATLEFDARRDWWSLKPLAPRAPPAPGDPNDIDGYVDRELARIGIAAGPEADRRTLVRRVTYDLTGLPPSPEDVEAFCADSEPGAYERLVDRLLASPRFGERFARFWLDLVHFGETHGYDKDKPRQNAWRYRDYVIASFNSDKPYSRFVQEQIAGDVLFPDDADARIATGFAAAGPWDFVGHVELREGTVDKAITRNLDRDDMVMNTMATFASTTVHCARCHDHKFDAITQDDYYSLQAVFAGVERADREFDRDPAVAKDRSELHARRAAIAEAAAGQSDSAESRERLGWHSDIVATADASRSVTVDLGRVVAIDRILLVPAHEAYGGWPGPGFGFPPRFRVAVADESTFAAPRVSADHTIADVANPGDTPFAIDCGGERARYVRVTATKLWERTGDFAFALGEVIVLEDGDDGDGGDGDDVARGAIVSSDSSIEAPPRWSRANLTDGVSATSSGRLDDAAAIRRWIERFAESARIDAELAALPAPERVYAITPVFHPEGAFAPSPVPRPVHVLGRGDVTQPLALATPGALRCVTELAARFEITPADVAAARSEEGARRAALAAWLVDPRNPLVARSIVNRVWSWHFGQGIVDTPSDFGHLGATPTHPALLDRLARDFLEQGGSLKALHRRIVTSAAYRRSSAATPEMIAKDAENRYLARMTRSRLDAEQMRDSLLAISGRLDSSMGGPSDRLFEFTDDHSPVYDYARFEVDSEAGRRRSIYRFVVRSAPDPFMECLDCPDASLLTPKRNVTITALSALALLNDAFVLRQCEHLAARVAIEQPAGLDARIARAFTLALAREPRPAESDALVAHARRHGLAAACRVIVNLDEYLFVD